MRKSVSITLTFLAVILSGCGGSGSMTSTPTPPPSPQWTWVSGSNSVGTKGGQPGVYGALGVAAASNSPGSRGGSVTWTDKSGNLWLFGGLGFDSTGAFGPLNDLWEFNPGNKEWTWMGGDSSLGTALCDSPDGSYGQPGVYGALGVPSTTNIPSARTYSVSWTDSSGNFWLFGGWGCSGESISYLNDLWKFSPAANTWTWVSGNNTLPPGFGGVAGVYGTMGVPSTTNLPGGRVQPIGWTDSSGNLWLFGGVGFNSVGQQGVFNDLWEFNPAANTWEWVGGSSTTDAQGVYGTVGVAAAGNVPGARSGSSYWTDSSGNFWLFGGDGDDGSGTGGDLNDIWEFSPSAKTWTWVSGSSKANALGVYGTLGVPAATNVPGARGYSVSWIDRSGNLWIFGGTGWSSTFGYLNDLWEFNFASKQWVWMGGSNKLNAADGGQPGIYGTLGTTATTNTPGGRDLALGWTDSGGNFWLFGGVGFDSTDAAGYLNDLWLLQP